MDFLKDIEEFNKTHPIQSKQINGVEFPYLLSGDGEKTVVLLVGGLGLSAGLYNHVKAFEKKYRVLCFDYPVPFKTNYQLAEGIAALLKELGIQKALFIGQSYGGFLAEIIAACYPNMVDGLVISNSGCLYNKFSEEEMKPLTAMMDKMEKVIMLTRFIPIGLLRSSFLKQTMRYLTGCTGEERIYMEQLFKYMFSKLTNKSERHMCRLMLDLMNVDKMEERDFAYLNGKVLLILSPDDNTFSEDIRKGLIKLMPNPIICTDLSGGHLALFLNIEQYIETVDRFIRTTV